MREKVCRIVRSLSQTINEHASFPIRVKKSPSKLRLGTEEFKEAVRKFRRAAQRMNKQKLVFIDATGVKEQALPSTGLAPKGKKAYVARTRPEAFQPRIDMLAACCYDGPLVATTITANERREAKTRGISKERLLQFIRHDLAPQIRKRADIQHIVVMDKGLHPSKEEVFAALREGRANNVEDVWLIPTGAAKLVSPLDNSMFATVKRLFHASPPANDEVAANNFREAFMHLSPAEVRNHYRHCALTCGQDVDRDLHE